MLTLIDDHGLVLNVILWLIVCFCIIIICCSIIQLIQMCYACHRLCNSTIYTPARKAYKTYQDFMRIDPLPVVDV
uniref:Envelope small membrane protein n=1 Tax=Miniopterus bat coronavirus/Kenya/KY33/2006 TaxID=983928 RepID=F1DB16_9ALPC|nr:envelope protein [Miniopterus bat coronavirus/Kenya/KY33/2006]